MGGGGESATVWRARAPTCTVNRFSIVQITAQYRCKFILLFERYSQLDKKPRYNEEMSTRGKKRQTRD